MQIAVPIDYTYSHLNTFCGNLHNIVLFAIFSVELWDDVLFY